MTLYSKMLQIIGKKRMGFFDDVAESYSRTDLSSISDIQFERLKNILKYANDNVPYYKNIFRAAGFGTDKINTPDKIKQLPILTKAIIKDNLKELKTTELEDSRVLLTSTGGSTGTPLDFYKDVDGDEWETAFMWHSWSLLGWKPGMKMAWFWGGPSETSQTRTLMGNLKWKLGGKYLFDAFDASEQNMQKWYDTICREDIKCAIGYASTLDLFSQYLSGRNNNLKLKFVISTAEKLQDFQRSNIEKAFGCKVYNQYGCRENRIISFECEKGRMHIRADNVFVEFVEDPERAGLKRILFTSLFNHGMPFIRYDTGDYGEPDDSRCSCGSPFPLMKINIGRVSDNFIASDGKMIHGEYFTHLMYGINGIDAFQFHQKDRKRTELLLVKNNEFTDNTEKMIESVIIKSHEALGMDTVVRSVYTDKIELAASGKHRFTISDVRIGE